MTASWFQNLTEFGLRPYVAAAGHQLPALDIIQAGSDPLIARLEDKSAKPFHHVYNIANALAFGARDLTMPGWVYIDCVLMQTAVVGFAAPKALLPKSLLEEFGPEAEVLDWLPVSGQTASPAIDGKTLVGFSLFSLRSYWPELPALGLATKALALEVYKARALDRFIGITQYDNPALAMHGRFGQSIEIVSARVPLHAQGDVSLVYGMKIDFDPAALDTLSASSSGPDFWVDAHDPRSIDRLEDGIAAGHRYFIQPPFQVREGQTVKLPVSEEKKS